VSCLKSENISDLDGPSELSRKSAKIVDLNMDISRPIAPGQNWFNLGIDKSGKLPDLNMSLQSNSAVSHPPQ
jgi:hypothetical protein